MNFRFLTPFVIVLIFAAGILFYWPRYALLNQLETPVTDTLSVEMRNALVSVASSNRSYSDALAYLVPGLKADLQQSVESLEHSFMEHCHIDLSTNSDDRSGLFTATLNVFSENKTANQVYLSVNCGTRWMPLGLTAFFAAISFCFAVSLIPPPFSRKRSAWIEKLCATGYGSEEAITVTTLLDQLPPLKLQHQHILDVLHEPSARNFDDLLQAASQGTLLNLKEDQLPWVQQAMSVFSVKDACQIGHSEDTLILDCDKKSITVHGWEITLSKTPFFYYLWYALQRLTGDGWYKNPQSNRPDKERGIELAQLMDAHEGHGKAVNDLNQYGLRSKTLDQNRSKIKEELTATLGTTLAQAYLFETQKSDGSGPSTYRLAVPADRIEIRGLDLRRFD